MTTDDDQFEIRMGRLGRDRAPKLRSVRAAVRIAGKSANAASSRVAPRTGLRAHFRKSSGSGAKVEQPGQRRVVVKVKYATHGSGRGAPLRAHVSYLAREDMARKAAQEPGLAVEKPTELSKSVDYLGREQLNGEAKFEFYDGSRVGIDAKAITSGWSNDKRHFRMIISAEDGEALGNLKPFIRDVMAGLETKLGTRLEWLAVDHWDTDNPHTHVLIRGRRPDGQDLFIPSRMIAHGIRDQAQEVVTRVLGLRQGIDLVRERARDIAEKAVTPLDKQLVAAIGRDGLVRLVRPDLTARLEQLEHWGLAARERAGWRLQPGLLKDLSDLSERADVERAVEKSLRRPIREPLLAADAHSPEWGRVVHASADEFGDSFLTVIETGRGELRYARFEKGDDLTVLSDVAPGAIVAFSPAVASTRPSDEVVARISGAADGLYSAKLHAAQEPGVSKGLLEANVRRLEAMRRVGLIVRRPDGVFETGRNHLDRALAFEGRLLRRYPVSARVTSYWALGEQVGALGPTHLDRALAGEAAAPAGEGRFARDFNNAMQQRRLFLIEQGLMGREDRTLSPTSISRMADAEMRDLAKRLSRELGVAVSTAQVASVRGVYARRVDLAQGRVALILGDRSAHLVPWRPTLERFAGREVAGVLRGQTLSWGLARGGPSLPPM